jgi:hypothetical protein
MNPCQPTRLQNPLRLPSLELLSHVKNPNPTRFGDWSTGKDDDKLGTMWRRLCVIDTQVDGLIASIKVRRARRARAGSQAQANRDETSMHSRVNVCPVE